MYGCMYCTLDLCLPYHTMSIPYQPTKSRATLFFTPTAPSAFICPRQSPRFTLILLDNTAHTMANTQGLTDEEMLQSMNETVRDWSSGNSAAAPRSRHRLAERLDHASSSGAPAARVIRKSTPGVKIAPPKGKHYAATPSDQSDETQQHGKAKAETDTPVEPVLGNIKERPRGGDKGRRRRRATAQPTRAPTDGFPSLQRPLGTFAPKKASAAATRAPVRPSSTIPDDTTTRRAPPATTIASTTTNKDDIDALIQASAQEADQMLAGMSQDEIRASAQELQTLLSPQSLAFLQQRQKPKTGTSSTSPVPVQSTNDISNNSRTIGSHDNDNDPNAAERREKERVAKLLAGVQTYDDMDAVYRAEMGEQALDFVPPSSSTTTTTTADPFVVACDLLRSTAPRQMLWGIRHVRDGLASAQRRGTEGNVLPGRRDDYPTVLPVSLRCLLDREPNPNNGFILHTYTLEALYSLLRLRCPEEHAVDLTDTESRDGASLYQFVLGEDAVPTPSIETVYQSSQVKPLSLGQHENVAYATASSSETAVQDGEKFAKDPLWTLLSQMRIIPRLAFLFQFSLPVEAWVAAARILSMLAHRSPGAATAMVQHKTLLKDMSRVVWDNSEAPAHTTLSLVVVRLWTVLARQSRTAAAGLELPPWGMVLGVKQSTVTGKLLQRWSLVLWRTFLRYGLSLQEFEAILTLAAPHVSMLNSKSSALAADYLSCFSIALRVHHDRVTQAADATVREHEIRQLVKVRSWLTNCYRQALAYLAKNHDSAFDTTTLVLVSACLRFCHQYLLKEEDVTPNPPGEFKSEESTVEDDARCLHGLQGLADAGIVSSCMSALVVNAFQMTKEASDDKEIASVAFLNSYTCMLRVLQKRLDEQESALRQALKFLLESLSTALIDLVTKEAAREHSVPASPPKLTTISCRNRGRFVLLELMRIIGEHEKINSTIRLALGVSAVGSMQVGGEALLDRILRMEIINFPAELRSMVLGQLRSGQLKQLQILHSSILNCDFLPDQAVTTELQSLRSEADSAVNQRGESDAVGLPLGEYWLWKVLGGSASPETPIEQVVRVLSTTLSVIDELETGATKGLCLTRDLEAGSRMYFTMNICTMSEDVLGNEDIERICDRLRRHYSRHVDDDFVRSFADACVGHSSLQPLGTSSKEREGDSAEDSPASKEEKKLADAILEEKVDPTSPLSGRRLRIVMDFVNDLCTAFCDYGAQYDFFGPFFRVFLYPSFPSHIRCEVIRRLQGLLHLLSSPTEDRDAEALSGFLQEPQADGDTLDTLASCFAKNTPIREYGLFEIFTVGSLGMSLSVAAKRGSLDVQKRRLANLQSTVLARVAEAAELYSRPECSVLQLSEYLIQQDPTPSKGVSWDEVVDLVSSGQ